VVEVYLRASPVRRLEGITGTVSVKILVSNDDGYASEGIQHLRRALEPLAEVTVVAPDRNRSGAGNSLTLDVPLRLVESAPRIYYAAGTPTDCVHLAISGVFDFEFDMVASGINDGANLGDDVLYSGTVAAAIEGRFLGLPAVAFSLCTTPGSGRHFETAARVASALVGGLLKQQLEAATILNVNIPDVPYAQLAGYASTRLGFRDPRGHPVYWIGPAGAGADIGAGTDFDAVARRFVSVTPLSIDLTRHNALPVLERWLEQL
jgi:5'-nucleotidase